MQFNNHIMGLFQHTRIVTVVFLVLLGCSMCTKPIQARNFQPSNWDSAHATFYGGVDASGTQGGACGYGNLYSQGYRINTVALSTPLFNNGAACGACFELTCYSSESQFCLSNASSIIVTATNFCPSGSEGGWCDPPKVHFDLSQPIFAKLAQEVGGVIPVKYRRVPCVKNGGMKFTINGNLNFFLILLTNVAGAGNVKELYIKGSSTDWQTLSRNWGENWQLTQGNVNIVGQALSFRAIASDGSEAISMNIAPANWQFSQTFEGSNF